MWGTGQRGRPRVAIRQPDPFNITEDPWKNAVHLAGHCITCLKKLPVNGRTEWKENMDLNDTWSYLFGRLHHDFKTDYYTFVTFNRGDLSTAWAPPGLDKSSFPPFCNSCLDRIARLAELQREFQLCKHKLTSQVLRFKKLAKASRRNGWYSQFKKSLNETSLPQVCVENTTEFFDKLHGGNQTSNQIKITKYLTKYSFDNVILFSPNFIPIQLLKVLELKLKQYAMLP